MSSTLWGQIFKRRTTTTANKAGSSIIVESRGAPFVVGLAEGGWMLNRIGYGKATVPGDSLYYTKPAQKATPAGRVPFSHGDVLTVWLDDGGPSPKLHRVAEFIINSHKFENGLWELSGDNYLGSLNEATSVRRIGEETYINTTTTRAHYGPRNFWTFDDRNGNDPVGGTGAGANSFITQTPVTAYKYDVFSVEFYLDGPYAIEGRKEVWNARIQEVIPITSNINGVATVVRHRLVLDDKLPYRLPAARQFTLYTDRVRVADSASFVAGEIVEFVDTLQSNWSRFTSVIKSVPEPDNNLHHLELEHYIPRAGLPAGVYAKSVSIVRTSKTDVEQLLEQGTGGAWRVNRSPRAISGSTYEPNAETTFQALMAIADMTGYVFRLTRSASPTKGGPQIYDGALPTPNSSIDYFPVGDPYPVNRNALTALGTQNKMASGYGEIIRFASELSADIVTHLIPYGAGSGKARFDFREADFEYLAQYPDFDWGVRAGQYYIYNKTLANVQAHIWRSENFSYIKPFDEADLLSRRDAANALLVTACEWLTAHSRPAVTYKIDTVTVADPWPGDVIYNLDYIDAEPQDVRDTDLTISEVSHKVDKNGVRYTTLALTKAILQTTDGQNRIAQIALEFDRMRRHANAQSIGGARMAFDRVVFKNDGIIGAADGNAGLRAVEGRIVLDGKLGVYVTQGNLNVAQAADIGRELTVRGDITQVTQEGEIAHYRIRIVRGVPRLELVRPVQIPGPLENLDPLLPDSFKKELY